MLLHLILFLLASAPREPIQESDVPAAEAAAQPTAPPMPPVHTARWKLPFRPDSALQQSDGSVTLFHGSEIYTYSNEGELLSNHSLDRAPESAFMGPADTIWLQDGRLLGVLNEHLNMSWQQEYEPNTLSPALFGNYLVYVVDKHIMLLDPQNGQVRFSKIRPETIAGIRTDGDQLLISDTNGAVISWDPVTAREHAIMPPNGQELRFVAPAPQGGWTMVYRGGQLKMVRPGSKRAWQRDYRIEIPTAPVWLQGSEKFQLLVASQARRVVAYNERGIPQARYLLGGRPKHMVPWSSSGCLIVPGLVNLLIWYDALEQRFYEETIDSYITLVSENSNFVLLVDNDAIIRLYKRELPLFSRK